MNANAPALQIDGIIIPVTPDREHEYTLTTAEVAAGYGISKDTLKKTFRRHIDELIEGKHWFLGVGTNCPHPEVGENTARQWTKRGIIRLGCFIKSDRARRFRDLAEDLILRETSPIGSLDSAILTALRALRDEVDLLRDQLRHQEALLLSASTQAASRLRLESIDPDRHDVARLVAFLAEKVGHPVRFPEVVGIAKELRLFPDKIAPYNAASTRSAVGKAITKHAGEVFRLPDGRTATLNVWGRFRARRYYANLLGSEIIQ